MSQLQNKKFQKAILEIPGWLSLEEGLLLYKLTKKLYRKGTIVEIGSFQGKSTVFIASALKDENCGNVYGIDPHKGETTAGKKEYAPSFKAFLKNVRQFQVDEFVIPIRKTSEDANRGWKRPISLLFIDGLHDYLHAKQDLELWLPHLVSGGVVACHDAFSPYPEVFKAVHEELFESGTFRYISFTNSVLYAVKGKAETLREKLILLYNISLITFISLLWHSRFIPVPARDFLVTVLKRIIIKERVFDQNR